MLKEPSKIDDNASHTLARGELSDSIDKAFANKDNALLASIINNVHYADLADYLDFASFEQRKHIIELLNEDFKPEILQEFKIDVLRSMVGILGVEKFVALLSKLDNDHAIDLLDDFDNEEKELFLSHMPPGIRKVIKTGLEYPKNSAGIIMLTNFIAVKEDDTVGNALDQIANSPDLPEELDEIFVLDKKSRPIGVLHVTKLIRNKHDVAVKKIMEKDIQLLPATMDQEEVSYIFRHYDLSAAPVVNKSNKMVGVICIDQIVDVVEEEAEEDIMKLGGVKILDIYSAFFKTATQRFPWLFFNLLTACLTSVVINMFGSTIEQMVTLAAIMPIVASMGGNAGTQTVTVAVRAIANKDITVANSLQVIGKEIAACALNGLMLGLIGAVILLLIYHSLKISIIFALAVIINFSIAGLLGSVIPISLTRLGTDPAISSSVLLTFLTDLMGFCLFLGLASWVI